MSQRQVCKAFNARRGALQNQLHGKVADDARMGGQTVLTAAEDALEEYIILMTEPVIDHSSWLHECIR